MTLGIDPGQNGAIAALGANGELLDMWSLPGVDQKKGADPREARLFALMDEVLKTGDVESCALEYVRGYKLPAVSSFTFGWNYGIIRCALVANDVDFFEVTPAVWQRHCATGTRKSNGGKEAHKEAIYQRALALHPTTKTKKGADAVLIAHYAYELRTTTR